MGVSTVDLVVRDEMILISASISAVLLCGRSVCIWYLKCDLSFKGE